MYITKIDNSRKNVFFAAMPEQKIIEGIQGIIRKKEFPIVSQKMDYFVDMQKGSKINPDRKLEINDWLESNLKKYLNFDSKIRKQIVIQDICREEYGNMNLWEELIKKIKNAFTNRENTHPLMQEYYRDCDNAGFFKRFKEIFSSYIELNAQVAKSENSKLEKPFHKDEYTGLSIEEQLKKFYKDNFNVDITPPEVTAPKITAQPKPEKATPPASAPKPKPSNKADTLRAQYDECQEQLKLFKPYNNMSDAEKDEFHLWNKNVFSPLLDNIKHNNVSTVQGLHFPIDGSLEQKKNFWNNVFLRMKDSNASFFDGISLFEKFGYRDFCDDTGANSLSAIALAFPHNPDDKTICKVFDVFNKFAIFKPGDSADAISFFNILQTPGVLKNQDFIKLAFDKGKNFIWDIDSILSLKFNLLDKSDAPFKDNDFVRNVFDIAIANSHKVREPFKDNPDIFLYEAKRNILR